MSRAKYYICKKNRRLYRGDEFRVEFIVLQLSKQAVSDYEKNGIKPRNISIDGIVNKPFDSLDEAWVELGIMIDFYEEREKAMFEELKKNTGDRP